jgi:hypothetical protein
VLDIPALTLESCTLPAFTHLLFSRVAFSAEINRIMGIQPYLIFRIDHYYGKRGKKYGKHKHPSPISPDVPRCLLGANTPW